MLTQKAMQLPMRHGTSTLPSTTTKAVSNDDAYSILAKQRLNRPISPHLGIYRWQTSWILSGLNRITGSALSGGLYTFAFLYLISPAFGWHLESATLAASFGALPVLAKFLIKSTIALPFTFHSFNGIRHLMWDTGAQFKNQQVIRTGWTVVGISVATALGLAWL
ncbi:MAG: hypothetical protein Q9160_003160 [Pyrenula sp. 1 TL-2023]